MEKRKIFITLFLNINSKINLTSIRDENGVYIKHILDSLELTKIIDLKEYKTLCDVGTGGGFPLLSLSFYNKDNDCGLRLYGIDARRKKIDAIQHMIEVLNLPNTEVIWTRAEEHKVQYDIVTARAVAYADQIVPWCASLCKKGGVICLYKEFKIEEKDEIIIQCKKHNLRIMKEHSYQLFDGDIQRVIYCLSKE